MSLLLCSMDAHKGIENARYASLATIEPSTQLPSTRTIVIRGLYNNNALVTTTDIRSHKVKQWEEQREQRKDKRAYTEVMFWLGLSKEQFRFMCWVELIDSETSDCDLQQHRKDSWSKMPPSLRSDFENAPPGSVVKRSSQGDLDKYDAQETDEKTPSKNFAVVLLHPLSCDYLRLKTPEADAAYKVQHRESVLKPVRQTIRWLHTYDESKQSWNVVELNP